MPQLSLQHRERTNGTGGCFGRDEYDRAEVNSAKPKILDPTPAHARAYPNRWQCTNDEDHEQKMNSKNEVGKQSL